jgi:hypothetical protein
MSVLLKFLIILGILLPGEFMQYSAYAGSLSKTVSERSFPNVSQKDSGVFASFTSNKEQHNHKTNVFLFESEEENELLSFKKRHVNSTWVADRSFAQTAGLFLTYSKITLLHQHYSYSASFRYLIIQVFRI